jgi:Serpin (serine protease inhibitor)
MPYVRGSEFRAVGAVGFRKKSAMQNSTMPPSSSGSSVPPAGGSAAVPALEFNMRMDHPFFYAVRGDQIGALLFIGTLVNPS